jgi:hypothetical protein
MCRIADDGLVEVSDLNIDPSLDVGDWAQVPGMTVPADPNVWSHRNCCLYCFALEPLIESNCVAAHIGMGRFRHLEVLTMI